jgi:hypothetical protein
MIFKRRAKGDPATAVTAFWTWWATGRSRVEQAIAGGSWDPVLIDEINALVTAIDPGLAWEFGAGTASQHLLVVTANGDRALRVVAERWRRAGPAPDTTFGYAASRQANPSALDSRLDLDGHRFELGALRFAADVDDDAVQIDVCVWHPAFPDLPDTTRVQIAFLALDWLLGEDGVEIWVREIDTTGEEGPDLTGAELAATVAALMPAGGEPQWTVLSGNRGGRPVLASVCVPLKAARWPAADTHVRLDVPFHSANAGGLPVDGSLAALHAFEDRLFAYADGPVLVAHESADGVRTYHLYADRQAAVDALAPITASWPEGRVRTTVTPDPAWKGVSHLA